MESPILLFDGVCNFCNDAIRFLVPRDRKGVVRFAALQSETGRELRERFGLDPEDLDTAVLVVGDRLHLKSSASFRMFRYMTGAWPLLAVLLVIPKPLRDRAYDYFAANRYRWFGRSDACLVPTPELRERFLA